MALTSEPFDNPNNQSAAQTVSAFREAIRTNPNNPALFKMMESPPLQSPPLGIIFDWYSHRQISDQTKGVLIGIIVSRLREDAHLFNPGAFGVDVTDQYYQALYRGLGYYLNQSIELLNLTRQLQAEALDVRRAPKFIAALGKSGSSLLGICLGNMVKLSNGGKLDNKPFEWRDNPAWWKLQMTPQRALSQEMGASSDWDLRPEIGADPMFLVWPGAVYKGHIPPVNKNLGVLDLYKESRYVIIVRDPRDWAPATFCNHLSAYHDLHPDEKMEILSADKVHDELTKVIQDGQLQEALHFIGKWLDVRHRDRSIVVTYEQLMNNPLAVLNKMAALYEMDYSEDQLQEIYDYAAHQTNRETGAFDSGYDKSIYPLGWTGRIGIYQTYFSNVNTEQFNRVFRAFCQSCPWGDGIMEMYPELKEC